MARDGSAPAVTGSKASVWLRRAADDPNAWLGALAFLDFLGHMLVAGNYGYFRDELYYLLDGRHPSLGYVDQTPLIGWLAWLTDLLVHDSLVGIHIIPAIVGGVLVFVAGLFARELGAGKWGQVLAALGTMFSLLFMATPSIFSMDVNDELLWTLAALMLARTLGRQQPRGWLAFGLVAGIGLLNKLTMLFFGFGAVLGVLFTPNRRDFATRWPWLGGLIAFVGLLPDLIWNATHQWATLRFWTHYGGLSGGGPIDFLVTQLIIMGPLTPVLAVAGLLFLFRAPEGKPYRALGWTYVVLYVLFNLIHAKPYFLGPIYPMLFAAGAVQLERAATRRNPVRRQRYLAGYTAAVVLSGLLLAPLAMPILPPATFAHSYSALAGVGNAGAGQGNAGAFPQYLADRFGWPSMAATVQGVYDGLPADERAHACIFTVNYGEASALTFYGPQYHLPPALSGHNNFYFWGPQGCSGAVLITVGYAAADMSPYYARVVQAATNRCQYCVTSNESDIPILVCTQPRMAFTTIWQRLKHLES